MADRRRDGRRWSTAERIDALAHDPVVAPFDLLLVRLDELLTQDEAGVLRALARWEVVHGAHPLTRGIENDLREARAALHVYETLWS